MYTNIILIIKHPLVRAPVTGIVFYIYLLRIEILFRITKSISWQVIQILRCTFIGIILHHIHLLMFLILYDKIIPCLL